MSEGRWEMRYVQIAYDGRPVAERDHEAALKAAADEVAKLRGLLSELLSAYENCEMLSPEVRVQAEQAAGGYDEAEEALR